MTKKLLYAAPAAKILGYDIEETILQASGNMDIDGFTEEGAGSSLNVMRPFEWDGIL